MSLTRQELDDYVRYAEHLSKDLEVTIADLEFRASGGKLHLAVDFSEVHAFLIPEPLDDSWLWPGLDEGMKGVVEHCALSEVLTGPPKPLLLPPYLLEFQTFLTHLRAGILEKLIATLPLALETLNSLTEEPYAQSVLALAVSISREKRPLTEAELKMAVSFFETHARDLVVLVRGEIMEPLARTRAFLQTRPFTSLDAVVPVQLTGREPEVVKRFRRLQRLRGPNKDGASFVDALAIEYVRRANEALMRRGENARVLLVSRSTTLQRLVGDELRAGLWPTNGHELLRHPRTFAPLAWHARRAPNEVVPQLNETKASLDLCRTSAGIRLNKGAWTSLHDGRADKSLVNMVRDLKARIVSLVQMGGGVNESRLLSSKTEFGQHEVLRLLAMVRTRDEVLQAVSERMLEINAQIDREHETIGVLLQDILGAGREIAVTQSSTSERIVLPRMGRLPYAIRFRTTSFLHWLDELRGKQEITRGDLLDLFVRAAKKSADHYETLLFMAYMVAIVGQHALADAYCASALANAERAGREDRAEAIFFRVVCTRILARGPERLEEALAQLTELRAQCPTEDPRYLAEEGNIKLKWWLLAQDQRRTTWRKQAPGMHECIEALLLAESTAREDRRLLASIQNSLCYAYSNAFKELGAEDDKVRANQKLNDLMATLESLEPDWSHWPLRIKDTIVECILLIHPETYDASFLAEMVASMERDLKLEGPGTPERRLLQRRLRQFRQELARPDR